MLRLVELEGGAKMANNEIIKELGLRIDDFSKSVLDLINRQKIESNKYRNRVQSQKGEITRLHKKVAELTAELEEQKAEIERLNEKITAKDESNYYFMGQLRLAREKLLTAKFEAIKEFAEKLKKRFYLSAGRCVVDVYHIDNLVKEMAEVETNQRKEDEKNG